MLRYEEAPKKQLKLNTIFLLCRIENLRIVTVSHSLVYDHVKITYTAVWLLCSLTLKGPLHSAKLSCNLYWH